MVRVLHGQRGVYQLAELCGTGGGGTVYRARDPSGNVVAVKLSSPGPALRERFEREAQTLARITQQLGRPPELLCLLDRGDVPVPFVVMPYFPDTLHDTLSKSPPLLTALDLLTQAAHAVSRLHGDPAAPQAVHGDVKPQNLLVRFLGDRPQLVLADFGTCTWSSDPSNPPYGRGFSPWYSGPELLLLPPGQPPPPASDVFSLAVVVVEALTGAPPAIADPAFAWLPERGRGLLERHVRRSVQEAAHVSPWPLLDTLLAGAPDPWPDHDALRLHHGLQDACLALHVRGHATELPGLLAGDLTEALRQALSPDPSDRPTGPAVAAALTRAHDRLAAAVGGGAWLPVSPSLLPTQLASPETPVAAPTHARRWAGALGAVALVAAGLTWGVPDRISSAPPPAAQLAARTTPEVTCARATVLAPDDADIVIGVDAGPAQTFFGSAVRALVDVTGDGLDELVVGARKSDALGDGNGLPGATYIYASPLGRGHGSRRVRDAWQTLLGADRTGVGVMGSQLDTLPGVPLLAMGDAEQGLPPRDGHVWLLRDFRPGTWSLRDVGSSLPNSSAVMGDGHAYGSTVALGHVDSNLVADLFVTYSATTSDDVGTLWLGDIEPGHRAVAASRRGVRWVDEVDADAGFYRTDFVDLSGDGRDDLVLAPRHSTHDLAHLHVVWGTDDWDAQEVSMENLLDGHRGFTLQGPPESGFGEAVQAAGDVDADGFPDLIVAGRDEATVVFGPLPEGRAELALDAVDFMRIEDLPRSQSYANQVFGLGDLDLDGYDDVLVCGSGARHELGTCWLLFGAPRTTLPWRMSTSWIGTSVRGMVFRNPGPRTRWLGQAATAADFDGDGIPDLALSGYPGVFVFTGPVCPSPR